MERGDDGYWQVTEIKNIEQLLEKLQRKEPRHILMRS